MKRPLLAGAACLAVTLGLWLATKPEPVREASSKDPSMAMKTDGAEIFKKVLWRAPLPEDKILHAERREWSEGKDLQRWQWFLHVEASKDLSDYLRVANAFGLAPAEPGAFENAPDWFPKDPQDYEVQRAGAMTFLFHKSSNTFYATSQGKGFTKALPASAAKPITGPQPQGRVPTTAPPPG